MHLSQKLSISKGPQINVVPVFFAQLHFATNKTFYLQLIEIQHFVTLLSVFVTVNEYITVTWLHS